MSPIGDIMNRIPFKDRKDVKRGDFAYTYKCDECDFVGIWPEDFVSVDGKTLCGNCCQKRGVMI